MTKFVAFATIALVSICQGNLSQILTGNPVQIIDITAAALAGKWDQVDTLINRHLEHKYKLHLMSPLTSSVLNLPPEMEEQMNSAIKNENGRWHHKHRYHWEDNDIKKDQKKSAGYRILTENSTEAENDFDPELPQIGYIYNGAVGVAQTTKLEIDEDDDE